MLKVGDKVKSKYYPNEENIIRTIVRIEKDENCSSGYLIWADEGKICKYCKRPFGRSISGTDSNWFEKTDNQSEELMDGYTMCGN